MDSSAEEYFKLDIWEEMLEGSPYIFRDILQLRNNLKFLRIETVNGVDLIMVSKNNYDFTIRRFARFGFSHSSVSLFWLLTELLAIRKRDLDINEKYILPRLSKEIQNINNFITLLQKSDGSASS